MNRPLLIRGARQLLTLHGPSKARRGTALRDLGVIQDGALLIRNGVITDAGPTRRIENLEQARDAVEIDATGRVVMPGFVDSHTCPVFGPPLLDGYEMRVAGATGEILASAPAVRDLSSRTLESRGRQFLRWFVRHGTTTVEGKAGYGLDRRGQLKMLRVLAALDGRPLEVIPTYLGDCSVPPEIAREPGAYIDWICAEMLPAIRRRRLARFVQICCARGAFGLEDARRYLGVARELGFGLKIHADQFTHTGAARLAVELGAVSADHLVYSEDDDIAALAQSPTIATLMPGSVFHLGLNRYPPARALIERGAAVALATDFNPASSPTCSMAMVVSLACAQMRMTPAEAIAAATINGAWAARCADRAGSLEAGKQADVLVLDASDYRDIPYYFGVNLVAMTIKKGVILYRQAEVHCPED